MAETQNRTYPVIPVSQWWALRARFVQSVPSQVTPGFLAATLGIRPDSAKTGILPSLIILGIVDQEGRPTARARRWRADESYAEVCKEIREEIYPRELLESLPGPQIDRSRVEGWFSIETGTGKGHVQKMAAVYELLVKADPTPPENKASKSTSTNSNRKRNKAQQVNKEGVHPVPTTVDTPAIVEDNVSSVPQKVKSEKLQLPSFHFDIQIHISPDASAEQIDQIFGSMARHLSKLTRVSDE